MIRKIKGTKILITGAEGFIGSHLTHRLYKLGAEVNAIVHPESLTWRIEDLLDKIKVWPVDLLDERKLRQVLFRVKPAKIYHLAANIDHRRAFSLFNDTFRNNVYGTINLLHGALKLKLDCFINTGTCEEYGMNDVPFNEEQRECPVSPYSVSKVCITYICTMFHKTYGLPIVIPRPFLTYGPAQDAHMLVPSLILSCIKNKDFKMTQGQQSREFNYVDDIVDGFVKASITPRAIGEVINLGNSREYRVIDVAQLIKKLTHTNIKLYFGALPYRKGEAMRFYSASKKAKYLLNWRAKMSLEEGLKQTINWYREHYTIKKYK